MLVELCARNHVTLNGIINGAYGIFQDYTKTFSKPFIWINFPNPQIGSKTRIKNSKHTNFFLDSIKIGHLYNEKMLKYK